MEQTIAADLPSSNSWISKAASRVRSEAPTLVEWTASLATAILLFLSFPNFELSFLAWISLVPLLVVLRRRPSPLKALILGWVAGTLFFYVSCYWLTYSMIHYGGLPTWAAYVLLVPGAMVVGIFPGLFAATVAVGLKRWDYAILLTPFLWVASEWLRLVITGQLWNALGYSQAYHPYMIQTASWGGVYLVSFLITAVNAAIALAVIQRKVKGIAVAAGVVILVIALIFITFLINSRPPAPSDAQGYLNVVAVQPNVPMTVVKTVAETKELTDRHLTISTNGLSAFKGSYQPRLVIWPESPMNFTYSTDSALQRLVGTFAKENHAALLINSLEPAPNDGGYNSAVLINEDGRLIAQYDKIRLMPFGEYVPLPTWLGGSLISGIVGEFAAGDKYTLLPVANHKAGVFICIESAYPYIARNVTHAGADFLINISNDGYLGPTAVMRQHLANAVFRAVENGRPLLRVTNSGISAYVSPEGRVNGATPGFVAAGRLWAITDRENRSTFYTRHGDVFAVFCGFVTLIFLTVTYVRSRRSLITK